MREHLNVLKIRNMTHFPKEKVRGRCTLNIFTYNCKFVKIPVWCFCKMPECIGNMICCENRKCKTWFRLGFGSKWVAVSVLWTTESVSSGKLFQIEFFFFQTIRCWLLNSVFSPNDLRHTLFKNLIPNILNAMPSKKNVNRWQNVSPACEPGIFITRNRHKKTTLIRFVFNSWLR